MPVTVIGICVVDCESINPTFDLLSSQERSLEASPAPPPFLLAKKNKTEKLDRQNPRGRDASPSLELVVDVGNMVGNTLNPQTAQEAHY